MGPWFSSLDMTSLRGWGEVGVKFDGGRRCWCQEGVGVEACEEWGRQKRSSSKECTSDMHQWPCTVRALLWWCAELSRCRCGPVMCTGHKRIVPHRPLRCTQLHSAQYLVECCDQAKLWWGQARHYSCAQSLHCTSSDRAAPPHAAPHLPASMSVTTTTGERPIHICAAKQGLG